MKVYIFGSEAHSLERLPGCKERMKGVGIIFDDQGHHSYILRNFIEIEKYPPRFQYRIELRLEHRKVKQKIGDVEKMKNTCIEIEIDDAPLVLAGSDFDTIFEYLLREAVGKSIDIEPKIKRSIVDEDTRKWNDEGIPTI
jgi:hypothetical protein